MCNNGFGGGNCCWIIILLIIIWCCCGNSNSGCNCGCNRGCNSNACCGLIPCLSEEWAPDHWSGALRLLRKKAAKRCRGFGSPEGHQLSGVESEAKNPKVSSKRACAYAVTSAVYAS